MRYVLAIATLVLAGVLLIFGIGQRTFLAGPAEIRYEAETMEGAAYAVLPAEVLDAAPGQPNVVVESPGAFVAMGSQTDVDAWVEPFAHEVVGIDAANRALTSTAVPAADAAEDGDAEEGEEAVAGLDPRGSDLWLDEWSANQDAASEDEENTPGGEASLLRVPMDLEPGQAALIAVDGTEPLPDSIAVSWVQDRSTPWAGPLLAGGALLAVVGGILYLLAVDHNRRGLGPRRGRRGPLQGIRNSFGKRKQRSALDGVDAAGVRPPEGRGRTGAAGDADGQSAADPSAGTAPKRKQRGKKAQRVALPAVGLVLAFGVTACSPSYWPDFGNGQPEETAEPEESAPNAAPVPVSGQQIDRIIQRLSETAGAADDALDADALAGRFTGDALAQRAANYQIREDLPSYEVVPPRITEEGLDYDLVQSTEGWPRTMFVTVASASGVDDAAAEDAEATEEAEAADTDAGAEQASSPSLALLMTQQTPQDNYAVSRVIALRGGISMPDAAPVEEGTALLSADQQGLVLSPGEVGDAFASVMQEGADSAAAENFDIAEDDALTTRGGAAWQAQAQQDADDDDRTVKYSVTVAQGEEAPVSLSTGTGGALVATTVIENRIEDADGGRWQPQAEGAVTALTGIEGSVDRLERQVAHQMLFFVPSAESGDKIQILGVTTELVGASE
ncbi:hypothetical protein K8P10_002052 [Leucobacter sp. Psy1]|uniref:glycosyltransferase n=1 Tax=Leucobacter sp. Psy1 TaxID=2875729 RepID=UPI001CD2D00B|nr:glycosyltransferase [Leucobacter sp. Psy1]UBH06541.1 hypothetical protein K8P10_002052 [Leucobacter sp. Psy1]